MVTAGGSHVFQHDLGGDSDAYVVDMQLKDADLSPGIGVNSHGYGGDNYYDFGAGDHDSLGVGWSMLDSDSIAVLRYQRHPLPQRRDGGGDEDQDLAGGAAGL